MTPARVTPARVSLSDRRRRRWGYTKARITTPARAAAWIDDVGFALLFAARGIELPDLWSMAVREDGWGPAAERAWAWKDELPSQGRAWYGPFLRGRKGFLAPDLLADLYPRTGEEHDFQEADLSPDAARIAELILVGGPASKGELREATGLEGKRNNAAFERALTELGRALVVTHRGVRDQPGRAWPSAVLELTARAFEVPSAGEPSERRARTAARFLATMVEATPNELARTFGWPVAQARAAIEEAAVPPPR